MRDEQWRLTYPQSGPHPGANLLFGTAETGYVTQKRPAFDYADDRTDDEDLTAEDGIRFGRDFNAGMNITFDLGVDTVDLGRSTADNLDAVDVFRRVWRARALKRRPGAVAELRTAYGGRERIFYGRPRRFAVPQTEGLPRDQQGYTAVLAEFQCVDQLYYDGLEHSIDIAISPPAGRGLVGPLKDPLTSVGAGRAERVMQVGGTQPCSPLITLHGPGAALSVQFVGLFTVGISGALAYDQWVRIDPRAFARTVLNQAGGSMAGRLTGVTRMLDMLIPPGQWEVVIRGTDSTGTARANVRWRDVYTYL